MLPKKIAVLMKKLFYTHSSNSITRQINLKPIMTITDPEAFKVAADETRRKILYLLRAKEMTVSKIADELNLTPQTVYHHIKKLCNANMVEVSKEVRVDHLIESYYRATAEVFHFAVGKESKSKETVTEGIKSALEALKKIGYDIKYDEKVINELAELSIELDNCCTAKETEEAISKLKDVDYFAKQEAREYAGLLSMTDEEIAKEDHIRRKFRKTLRSLMSN
jgi:DNA-binding transcriptional ArsR family regulator